MKAGLWEPDSTVGGGFLPLSSVRERMKKQALMTARMMTPEIRALVTESGRSRGLFSWAVTQSGTYVVKLVSQNYLINSFTMDVRKSSKYQEI